MESSNLQWPRASPLADVLKTIQRPTRFRAKVKLHGIGVAIVTSEFTDYMSHVTIRDKSGPLGANSFGGQLWNLVRSNEKHFHQIRTKMASDIVIYGELCGNGIRKENVACSMLPEHHLFIHAVKIVSGDIESDDIYEYDPVRIEDICRPLLGSRIHVLPWEVTSVILEPGNDNEIALDTINKMTDAIDKHDHYIHDMFLIDGIGKGFVWYATKTWYDTEYGSQADTAHSLKFVTKGVSHMIVRKAAKSTNTLSMDEYINTFLSQYRYEHGLAESCCDGTLTTTNKFVEWIVLDIAREADDRWDTFPGIESRIRTLAAEWYRKTIADGVNVVLKALLRSQSW